MREERGSVREDVKVLLLTSKWFRGSFQQLTNHYSLWGCY